MAENAEKVTLDIFIGSLAPTEEHQLPPESISYMRQCHGELMAMQPEEMSAEQLRSFLEMSAFLYHYPTTAADVPAHLVGLTEFAVSNTEDQQRGYYMLCRAAVSAAQRYHGVDILND